MALDERVISKKDYLTKLCIIHENHKISRGFMFFKKIYRNMFNHEIVLCPRVMDLIAGIKG